MKLYPLEFVENKKSDGTAYISCMCAIGNVCITSKICNTVTSTTSTYEVWEAHEYSNHPDPKMLSEYQYLVGTAATLDALKKYITDRHVSIVSRVIAANTDYFATGGEPLCLE